MGRRKNLNDKFGFVDSMKIKDFIDYEQPNEYIVESDRYSSKYSTPVLTAGQSFILGYTNESKGIYKKGPCIIFDDFTTSVHYVDFPFKVKSSAMKILTTKSNTDLKYCYYLLLSLSKMPPNHKRQWISTTSEKSYVLPSMDKQISIVKQLDLISDTIANYTNQIENLDNLVKARFIEMFGDILGDRTLPLIRLCELADIGSSKRIYANEYAESGIPFYRSKEIRELGTGLKPSIKLFIKQERYDEIREKYGVPKVGDILIAAIGATIGYSWIVDTASPFYYKDGNLIILAIKDNVNPIFLNHTIGILIEDFKKKGVAGSAQLALTIEKLEKMMVVNPELELQNQFADFVQQVDKSREDVKKSLEKTQQLYDSLMQEYFG